MCFVDVYLGFKLLFDGNTEMKRMSSTVKQIAHVLSDQRSKYSIVGTKTQKNE